MFKAIGITCLILASGTRPAAAKSSPTMPADSLRGRSSLSLNFGFTGGSFTDVSVRGGVIHDEVGGFSSSIEFRRWNRENLAVTFTAGAQVAKVDALVEGGRVSTVTALNVPILFGVRHYPNGLALGENAHFFVAAAVGPYIGVQDETVVDGRVTLKTRSEIALGINVATGVDWYVSRHLVLGLDFGYNAMTDFDEPIGGEKNHSGPKIGFGLGWVF